MNIHRARAYFSFGTSKPRGFTLVELMVALLLGLIVIAGVSSVFLANLRSYHSNTALSQVQSNARVAFELMARDIREAGLTGCNSTDPHIVNVLNNRPGGGAVGDWWANWDNVIYGHDSGQTDTAITGGMPTRVAGTDSLTLMGATGGGLTVAAATSTSLTVADTNPDIQSGDIVIVCHPEHSALTQITSYNAGAETLSHNAGGGSSPGNSSTNLGGTMGPNSKVSRFKAHDWYIGDTSVNGVAVPSLYRIGLSNVGGVPTPKAQEMVRNVTNMQITYHENGDTDFVSAAAVTNWGNVDAVHIVFTLQSSDQRAGTNLQPLTRTFAATTSIRDRKAIP